MAMRKSTSYSKMKVVPYTRKSKRKQKAFIKVVPPQSIVKFSMGNEVAYDNGKLPIEISMITKERVQIRSNALEACRQFVNKKLEKGMPGQYFFRVMPYPHHIQRENKMLTGAGADRMQTGMQLSFGKPIAKAALVRSGETVFFIALQNKKAEASVRHWLKQIKSKLPCRTQLLSVDSSKDSSKNAVKPVKAVKHVEVSVKKSEPKTELAVA